MEEAVELAMVAKADWDKTMVVDGAEGSEDKEAE